MVKCTIGDRQTQGVSGITSTGRNTDSVINYHVVSETYHPGSIDGVIRGWYVLNDFCTCIEAWSDSLAPCSHVTRKVLVLHIMDDASWYGTCIMNWLLEQRLLSVRSTSHELRAYLLLLMHPTVDCRDKKSDRSARRVSSAD